MEPLRKLIAALSMRQRISIVLVALIVAGGLYSFTHWLRESDFKPLYSSLSPEDAAAVVQKLKEAGTDYRVSDNGTSVLAPSARVAELRLDLAASGLPKTGRIGYELFDKTNFGATEFTEHLNYHRALEGELERSIGALSSVEQARVHLTFPKDSLFLDSRQPGKASVLLKLRAGAMLTPQNVAAVTNLVASAVEGLSPESVSVLDMRGNLLNRPHHDITGDQPSEATLEYRQRIENELLAKVNANLEPLLGADKFRAGISVDCDFTSGEQSEETVDPNKSVMVTSQKTEEQSGTNYASGQPGTASALPRPTSRPGAGGGGVTRRTENIAFQSSRVVRHTKLAQGSIKRLSISVLVDHQAHMEGEGKKARRVLAPPPPETLKVIHDVVAAATGFSVERGDQLVIESLPFETTRNPEPSFTTAPAPVDPRIPKAIAPYVKDFNVLVMAAAAVALLLILIVAVVLIGIGGKRKKVTATAPDAITEGEAPKGLSAEQVTAQMAAQRAEEEAMQNALQQQRDEEIVNLLKIPVATTKKAEVLAKHLRENIHKDADGTANVLRTWLSELDKATK